MCLVFTVAAVFPPTVFPVMRLRTSGLGDGSLISWRRALWQQRHALWHYRLFFVSYWLCVYLQNSIKLNTKFCFLVSSDFLGKSSYWRELVLFPNTRRRYESLSLPTSVELDCDVTLLFFPYCSSNKRVAASNSCRCVVPHFHFMIRDCAHHDACYTSTFPSGGFW